MSSLVVDSVRALKSASGICRDMIRFSSEGFPPIKSVHSLLSALVMVNTAWLESEMSYVSLLFSD